MINRYRHWLALCAYALCISYGFADTSTTKDYEKASLSAQTAFDQALAVKQSVSRFTHKKSVSDKSSELAVYISLQSANEQSPEEISVEINLNGNPIAQMNYNAKAIDTLLSGASHQIFVGHIPKGSHDLIAHIKERNSAQTISSHGAIRFSKEGQGKTYELSISVSENDIPPEIIFIDHS